MILTRRFNHTTKCLLLALVALGPPAFCADAGREIAKKEVTEHFASLEEAKQWLSTPFSLPFKQWLANVTFPGWQPLHSAETDTAYYALFRSGDYLIFWHADRASGSKLPTGQSSTGITAKADGRSVGEQPSRWATIAYRLEYPGGAITGQSSALAFKIKDGFHETLILNFNRARSDEAQERSAYRQEVLWTP